MHLFIFARKLFRCLHFLFQIIENNFMPQFSLFRMNTIKKIIISGLSFALVGCASSYKYEGSENFATLLITGNNRSFFSEVHANEECSPSEFGIRAATFMGPTKDVPDDAPGKTIRIPAGKTFFLTNYYIDARFAQNRKCGITVQFMPKAGGNYISNFMVAPEVVSCDAVIYEDTGAERKLAPEFKRSETYCSNGVDLGKDRQGKAIWLNWTPVIKKM
jgi:hypothetical protein